MAEEVQGFHDYTLATRLERYVAVACSQAGHTALSSPAVPAGWSHSWSNASGGGCLQV